MTHGGLGIVEGVDRIVSEIDTDFTYSLFCDASQRSRAYTTGASRSSSPLDAPFHTTSCISKPYIAVRNVSPRRYSLPPVSPPLFRVLCSECPDVMHTPLGSNPSLRIVAAFGTTFSFSICFVLIERDTSW
jgi:hypothetical protein